MKNQERVNTLKTNIDHINQTIKNWQNLNNGSDEFNERLTEIEALKLDKDLMVQRNKVLTKHIEETKNIIKKKEEKIHFFKDGIEVKNQRLQEFKEKLQKQEKKRNREILVIETLKKEKKKFAKEKIIY